MAATDPRAGGTDPGRSPDGPARRPAPAEPPTAEPLAARPLAAEPLAAGPLAAEPLAADLATRPPRLTTRMLLVLVLVLAGLLLVSVVVGFVVLHQPRLEPVPVPSVSSIP